MSINKVMVYVFCVVMSATVSAMELEKSLDVKRARPKDVVTKPVESSSPSYSLSFSLPTIENIANSANSLVSTYNNYMYNTEAFKKVGWPTTDPIAQQETEKSQEIYKRALQNSGNMDDYAFINRRQAICQRVLNELPDHPQGLQLALHCLKYHRAAMTPVDLTRFLFFVEEQREKSKKADVEYSQLTILPEEDNQLLDNLFKQTLTVKNYSNDEEKLKKDIEKKEESKKGSGKKEPNKSEKK